MIVKQTAAAPHLTQIGFLDFFLKLRASSIYFVSGLLMASENFFEFIRTPLFRLNTLSFCVWPSPFRFYLYMVRVSINFLMLCVLLVSAGDCLSPFTAYNFGKPFQGTGKARVCFFSPFWFVLAFSYGFLSEYGL